LKQPAYAAAQAVALKVHRHFAANEPDPAALAAIIDAASWASLRREEGHDPRISMALVAAADTPHPLTFERSLALDSYLLSKLAGAVERPSIHLGVWYEGDELRIWGTTHQLPPYCVVLEVVAPGLLVIKQSRGDESGKYINVAVLQGDTIKVVDQRAASVPDCPDLLTSLLGLEMRFDPASVNVLIQLSVSMRAHGRGGTLLVVPGNNEQWKESMLMPMNYAVSPPFAALADLMQEDPERRPKRRWQDALIRAVEGIAGLTAVDGATVITANHEVLAFGTKIVRRKGSPIVAQVLVTEPIEGSSAIVAEPALLGGTRHLSAAQFVHDQRDAIALVASQDGRFTVFAWSPCEEAVHAHRIDSLLL
jgi:hypothetical protein